MTNREPLNDPTLEAALRSVISDGAKVFVTIEGTGGVIAAVRNGVWVLKPRSGIARLWRYSELEGVDAERGRVCLRPAGRTMAVEVGVFALARADFAISAPTVGEGWGRVKAAAANLDKLIGRAIGRADTAPPIGTLGLLTKGARATVAAQLLAGERIVAVLSAADSSAVVATDRRVFVLRHGRVLAGWGVGRESMSIDYANLSGVEWRRGIVNGEIVLRGPGLPVGPVDHRKDWNALRVIGASKQDDAAVSEIRRRIAEAMAPQARGALQAPPPKETRSAADLIRDLAELRDAGFITPGEYEAKRQEILARM